VAVTCPRSLLGHTGLLVSRLGLGTVKLGRTKGLKYVTTTPATLPSDDEALALLAAAKDLGINLIDTAPAYGSSEDRLGALLPRVAPREHWVICTKAGETFDEASGRSTYDFTPESITRSVERSLRRLRIEHADVALLHFAASVTDELAIVRSGAALGALLDLKQRGLIRAAGASCADPRAAELFATGQARADVVMLTINPGEPELTPLARQASANGLGVLVKKPLGSGRWPVREALRAALADSAAHAAVLGTGNPAHLREAVESLP
jgi:aryl-alcohol dehydrogenase-like predicted oxidoreductase